MRCLFFPDELEAFRPVAVAIRDERVEFVMLRHGDAARLLVDLIEIDAVIVGASTIDSPALEFLRQWKPTDMPALGVTCVPWLRDELWTAGAQDVVLLPDETERLAPAIRSLLKQSAR
jgi:DNA-binding response OmpR family regulator